MELIDEQQTLGAVIDGPWVHYSAGEGFCLHPADEDELARLTYSAAEVIAHLAG